MSTNNENEKDNMKCEYCSSNEFLRRCLCKKIICERCLETQKNKECIRNCYIFQNGQNTTSTIYNLSKYPLPKNAEIKLYFEEIYWIRNGISFTTDIVNNQEDVNCPEFDIYYILEDLCQFYTLNGMWQNHFPRTQGLRKGDCMIITYKNGELQYFINDINLGPAVRINIEGKPDPYLLIHCRNTKSKAEIVNITEILN